MKKKEFLDFYKTRYKGINHGRGEWEFLISSEGKEGYLRILPRLLKTPPIQRMDAGASMAPSWYAELVHEIRGDRHLDFLFLMNDSELIPESGEVCAEDLEQNLNEVFAWYEHVKQPEVIATELARRYALGSRVVEVGPAARAKFCYARVLKGDVDLLESERLAVEDGASQLPAAYTLKFFENCVRLAKQYKNGERNCPVEF